MPTPCAICAEMCNGGSSIRVSVPISCQHSANDLVLHSRLGPSRHRGQAAFGDRPVRARDRLPGRLGRSRAVPQPQKVGEADPGRSASAPSRGMGTDGTRPAPLHADGATACARNGASPENHAAACLEIRSAAGKPEDCGNVRSLRRRGNFHVAGFAGNSAPDHMDHLYALDRFLSGR